MTRTAYFNDYSDVPAPAYAEPVLYGYLPRPAYLPLPFLLPVLLFGFSWLWGGVQMATDLGFAILTMLCLVLLVMELIRFPQRFGIGGIVLFGGILVWLCYDYMTNWFARDFHDFTTMATPRLIAKAAFWHGVFIMMTVIGLLLPWGRRLERIMLAAPDPASPNLYLALVIGLFLIGISPYFIWADEPWYQAIYHALTGGRVGTVRWTVGRTGNMNYSWGGYVAQILEVGSVGGQLAVFYAVLIARSAPGRLLGWGIWFFWLAIGFGSGTRSQVLFMGLPAVALLYLKYQAQAAALFRRLSLRAYVVSAIFGVVLVGLIQIQARYRSTGYLEVELSEVSMLKLEGNTMFSEGLLGYSLIPDQRKFFYDSLPGETLVRPIPQTLYWFVIGPVPRVLWPNKPVDPAWEWYNAAYTGRDQGREGTTISHGLVGYWYFRYGMWGVIEGGILFGLLMAICERVLQQSNGRPVVIMLSFGVITWLFRCFRGINFNALYGLLVGIVLLIMLIKILQPSAPQRSE